MLWLTKNTQLPMFRYVLTQTHQVWLNRYFVIFTKFLIECELQVFALVRLAVNTQLYELYVTRTQIHNPTLCQSMWMQP